MSKTAIVTDKAPKALGPYSAGVVSNGSINVSGQLGIDPATGKLAGDDIQSQTRQSLTNVKNILEAAGASMADVVETLHGRRGRDHRPSRRHQRVWCHERDLRRVL